MEASDAREEIDEGEFWSLGFHVITLATSIKNRARSPHSPHVGLGILTMSSRETGEYLGKA